MSTGYVGMVGSHTARDPDSEHQVLMFSTCKMGQLFQAASVENPTQGLLRQSHFGLG